MQYSPFINFLIFKIKWTVVGLIVACDNPHYINNQNFKVKQYTAIHFSYSELRPHGNEFQNHPLGFQFYELLILWYLSIGGLLLQDFEEKQGIDKQAFNFQVIQSAGGSEAEASRRLAETSVQEVYKQLSQRQKTQILQEKAKVDQNVFD